MSNQQFAKCRAKTIKGVSCKNSPMKGSKYCRTHRFCKFRGVPLLQNSLFHLIVGLLVAFLFFINGPSRSGQQHIQETVDRILAKITQSSPSELRESDIQMVKKGVEVAVLSANKGAKSLQDWNASSVLDRLEELSRSAKYQESQVNRLKEVIAISYFTGDYKRTLNAVDRLLLINPQNSVALFYRASVAEIMGNLDSAFHDYMTIAENNPSQEWQYLATMNIGIIYKTQGRLDDAERMLNQALGVAEASSNNVWISTVLVNLGNVKEFQGKLTEAQNCHEKSLCLITGNSCHRLRERADALANLANIKMQLGAIEDAIKMQHEALQIREHIGYSLGVALSHGNIGLYLAAQKKYDEAMNHQLIALRIRQSLDHKEGLAISYQNIGVIHLHKNEFDQAEASFKQSLDISKDFGNLIAVGQAIASLGVVAAYRGNNAEAKTYFEQAEEILLSIGAVAQAEYLKKVMSQYEITP